MKRKLWLAPFLLAALLLTGCDSNGSSVPEPPDGVAEGRFEAIVNGTEEISFEGHAGFASEVDGEGFVLALIADNRHSNIALTRWQATRPESGRTPSWSTSPA